MTLTPTLLWPPDHRLVRVDATISAIDTCGSFLVRAERAGNNRSGRTYTITYTATDASGNQTQRSATVHVPHSQ